MLASACLRGRDSAGTWVTDTLPGGGLHTVNTGPGLWEGKPEWSFSLAAMIGSGMEEGPASFIDVVDIEVDGFARVWVLDRRAHEIRVFTSGGAFVRSVGRYGHGPGEFVSTQGMEFDPGGRLWVQDVNNGRYSLFDTAGTPVKEFLRPAPGLMRFATWDGLIDRQGVLHELIWTPVGKGQMSGGYLPYDSAGGQFGERPLSIPFPPVPPLWLVKRNTPDAFWAGSAAEYRLHQIALSGDTIKLIERPDFVPLPLEPGDSVPSAIVRQASGAGGFPPEPNHQRTISGFIPDETGYLWVMRWFPPDSTSTMLDTFDRDGRYLGVMRVPYRLESQPEPIIRGGRLYAVIKDADDVQSVGVFRLVGRVR